MPKVNSTTALAGDINACRLFGLLVASAVAILLWGMPKERILSPRHRTVYSFLLSPPTVPTNRNVRPICDSTFEKGPCESRIRKVPSSQATSRRAELVRRITSNDPEVLRCSRSVRRCPLCARTSAGSTICVVLNTNHTGSLRQCDRQKFLSRTPPIDAAADPHRSIRLAGSGHGHRIHR